MRFWTKPWNATTPQRVTVRLPASKLRRASPQTTLRMCGITGYWDRRSAASQFDLQATAERMASSLVHRGPDDAGVWVDPAAGVALGFRRLAIVDLSNAGHQPMMSASGRYVVVFNGEIYNFESLRRKVQSQGRAPEFRGHSDTEVLLAAIEAWGLEEAVRNAVGMFAIALWDRRERRLSLVRDRVGVKPLYYGWSSGTFLFGSELKALRSYPGFNAEINRVSLTEFLRYGYVPGPGTIYQGFRKLEPGTILQLEYESVEPALSRYWSARDVALSGLAQPFTSSESVLADELDGLLRDAVGLRLIADVPVGVFLSGGVDSSTVAAVAQSMSARPIRTFSIGFAERDYDEAPHARAVANHLGTEHTELYVTAQDALAVVPKLPDLYDEPFGGSSQIPTYLVSAMARRHVTVCLSGDGGDELFCGYNRYAYADDVWKVMSRVPLPLRRSIARLVAQIRPGFWSRAYPAIRPYLPRRLQVEQPADKVEKLRGMLELASRDDVYRHLVSLWRTPSAIVVDGHEPTRVEEIAAIDSMPVRMMYHDLVTYLPDDILVKVDRASMGVSLEAREPLLDHRLIEFAWRLPLSMKLRNGSGKWLLRSVLDRYVPRAIIDRPKVGFGVPIDAWLRGPLRDWAEDLLDADRMRTTGYLHPNPIRERWTSHIEGRTNEQHFLWNVLMFQSWLQRAEARVEH